MFGSVPHAEQRTAPTTSFTVKNAECGTWRLMVRLVLVDGRKGVGDTLVLVNAQGEPLAFSQILLILKHVFESEDSYYSPNDGYDGKAYMLKAIIDVYSGVPFNKILERYNLENKLNVEDWRKPKQVVPSHRKIEKLQDVLT
jgi:hypothetical protein